MVFGTDSPPQFRRAPFHLLSNHMWLVAPTGKVRGLSVASELKRGEEALAKYPHLEIYLCLTECTETWVCTLSKNLLLVLSYKSKEAQWLGSSPQTLVLEPLCSNSANTTF